MYKFLSKNGQLIAFGLGAVITIGFLAIVFGGLEGFLALEKEEKGTTSIFDFGLYCAIALVILGAAAAVLFGIYQMITNPKGSIYGIAGIVALVGIFLVARAMGSDDAPIMDTIKEFNVTEGQSSFISGAITSALVFLGVAVVAILADVRNVFK